MNYDYLIHDHYDELTKSERKVADYVLKTGNDVIYATMSDVKRETGVGDATIIRFCQKLGFSGFSDFKIEIAKENYPKKDEPEHADFYDDIASQLTSTIQATAKMIDADQLNRAINLLTTAKRIYIFGVGGSGQVANALSSVMLRVGLHATAVEDPHFQAQVASLLDADSLVIGFSLSGRTTDTFDSLNIAKKNGAKVIAITKYQHSPIGKLGDVVLQTAIDEFLNGGSVAGRVTQLYVADVLVRGYEIQNKVDAVALRERVLRSIINKSIE